MLWSALSDVAVAIKAGRLGVGVTLILDDRLVSVVKWQVVQYRRMDSIRSRRWGSTETALNLWIAGNLRWQLLWMSVDW